MAGMEEDRELKLQGLLKSPSNGLSLVLHLSRFARSVTAQPVAKKSLFEGNELIESIMIFVIVILVIAAVIVLGNLVLPIIIGLFVYCFPLILLVGGIYLFTLGGGIGAFGLFIMIPGIILSIKGYFICKKCGIAPKIYWFWFGEFIGRGQKIVSGTRCLSCGDRDEWLV